MPLNQLLYLTASQPDYVTAQPVSLTLSLLRPVTQDFLLADGGSVSGVMRNPGGAAVANARVSARAQNGLTGKVVTADGSGQFSIAGLPAGRYTLAAYAAGNAPGQIQGVDVVDGSQSGGIELFLLSGGSIDVTVSDADTSAPLAGVAVAPVVETAAYRTFVTNAAGQAALADIAPGNQVVYLSADGYLPVSHTVAVAAGNATPLNVALRQAGTISGQVQRTGGGPAADLPVSVDGPAVEPLTARSDASGQFGFARAPDGEYFVAVGDGVGATPGRQDLTLDAANNDVVIDITLDYAGLSGRVLQAGGATPVAGASVTLLRDGQALATTQTGGDGGYRFLVFQPGLFDLVAIHPDIGMALSSGVAVSPGTDLAGQDVVAAGGALAVTVNAGGAALEGAALVLTREGMSPSLQLYTRTDAAGLATAPHLPAGTYALRVSKDGLASSATTIVQGGGNNSANIDLAAGVTVQGQIETASGQPAASALLAFANRATGQVVETISELDGTYAIDQLTDGVYDVLATGLAGQFQPTRLLSVTVAGPDPQTLDVTVSTEGATLLGRITDSSGAPVQSARIMLQDGTGQTLAAVRSERDGSYEIGRAPTGPLTLRVEAADYLGVEQSLSLPAAGRAFQDVTLGPVQAMALSSAAAARMQASLKAANNGFSNLEAWKTGGLVPPQKPDFLAGYQLPPFPVDAPAEVQSAWVEAMMAQDIANGQFEAWQDSYTAASQVGVANKAILASQSAILTGKVAAMSAMFAELAGVEVAAGATASLELAGAFATASSIVTNIEAAMQNPSNFDAITGASDAWGVAMKTLFKEMAKEGLSIPGDMFDIANDVRLIMNQIETLHKDEADAKARYDTNETARRTLS